MFLPEQKAQFLTTAWNADVREFVLRTKVDVDICYPPLTKEMFDDMKALGLEVNIWTVDDPELALRYVEWGADYITSNILE